jgi:hypothetical protein
VLRRLSLLRTSTESPHSHRTYLPTFHCINHITGTLLKNIIKN